MSVIEGAIARAREQSSRGDDFGAAATLDAVAADHRERVLPLLREVLGRLAVTEHGIAFRYVPSGTFVMGSGSGDPDEAPAHEVALPGFWMSEAPLSWEDFTRVLGWPAPPEDPTREQFQAVAERLGRPFERFGSDYQMTSRIRLQYCENDTLHASDWHTHDLHGRWMSGGKDMSSQELFGRPERSSDAPYRYDQKPMVAVDWELARDLARLMTSGPLEYRLPTEAEWERAARGCFRDADHPWGSAPPDASRADFDRFREVSLQRSRAFPPNDYGLFSMAGGVWEWCADDYDSTYYRRSPRESPLCLLGEDVGDREHVLRGGSWADCADALRVGFRSSSNHGASPTIGFRLVRTSATAR